MNIFNCTLPWTITEKHKLCQIIDINRNQSYADIVSIWYYHFIANQKYCPKMPKCKRSIYKMDLSTNKLDIRNEGNDLNTVLNIVLKDPNVLTIVDNYSYDLQSLIGEVGGTLGLFLGLSMFSFVGFIEYILRKAYVKRY